jgi:hypothetical protein
LPLNTLQKLVSLAKEGAAIIFHDVFLHWFRDWILRISKKQFDALIRAIGFIITNAAGVSNAAIGKGMFGKERIIKYLFANANVRHEMYLADNHLKCIRRKLMGVSIILLQMMEKKLLMIGVLLNTKF